MNDIMEFRRAKVISLTRQLKLLNKVFYYIAEEFKWGDKKFEGYNEGISASLQVIDKMRKDKDKELMETERMFFRKKEGN